MRKNILKTAFLLSLVILTSNIAFARHFSVNLKSFNGSFVTAEGGGGGAVNANRDRAGEWESFTLLDLNEGELNDGDPIAIKTVNGNFFSAINGGGDNLRADKTVLVEWETFYIERITQRASDNLVKDRDRVAFRTWHKKYISAVNGGGREVNAKPIAVGNSETFSIRLNSEPQDGKLSGPFTAPQMIIRSPVGVDDLARTEGDIKYCQNNYFGENFPNCYRGHEGTDFGLIGHVLTQLIGSIDVYAVAGGKVVAKADGNTDLCFYKFPPPPANSPAEDFVFCINDKIDAKAANFVVILQDDGVIAYYYHLKKDTVAVKVNDRVECGQFLGKIGSSGVSSAPHLHLTLQRIKPLDELKVAKNKDGSDIDERFKRFPQGEADFNAVAGSRTVAKIINPYSPMLWQQLSGKIPKKTCGKDTEKGDEGQPCSNIFQCNFGTICKDGKCQKPSLPRCGNGPPCLPGFACDNGRCVPRRP